MLKELACGNCGAPIALPSGELDQRSVKCEYCGTSFLVTRQEEDPKAETPEDVEGKREGAAQEPTYAVESVHGGIRFKLSEKQLLLPRHRPEGTSIEVKGEPGRRLRVIIPPKSKTGEERSAAVVLIVLLLLIGGGLLAWGMAVDGTWRKMAGVVVLLVFVAFLFAERSLRLSEEIRVEGGLLRRVRRSGGRFEERSLPWDAIQGASISVYLSLKTEDKELDIAINVTEKERRWIFEELRRFAAGFDAPTIGA